MPRITHNYYDAMAAGWTYHRNGISGRGFFAALDPFDGSLIIDPGYDSGIETDDGSNPDDDVLVIRSADWQRMAQAPVGDTYEPHPGLVIARHAFNDDGQVDVLLVMRHWDEPDRSIDAVIRLRPTWATAQPWTIDVTDCYRGDVVCGRWRSARALD